MCSTAPHGWLAEAGSTNLRDRVLGCAGKESEGQLRVQRDDGSVEILDGGGASWDDDSSSASSLSDVRA